MKRITKCVIVLILLSTDVIYAEIIRKEIVNPNGTTEFIFYSGEKEVARQVVGEDENLVSKAGTIPDGIVSEYYESGELQFEFSYKNGKYEGISREYYKSGKLSAETNLKNGIREGISNTILEAMSCGLPVIASNVGGIPFQIIDNNTGYYYRTSKKTAQKVIYLLKNPVIAAAIGEKGRQHVKKHFTIPARVADFLTTIDMTVNLPMERKKYANCITSFHPWY